MKKDLKSNDVSQVFYDILNYLANHPDAGDTIEGIMQWWLLEQKIRQQMQRVEKALYELGKKGFVLEHKGADGRTRYRINQHKHKQIIELLSRRQKDPASKYENGNI